MLFGLAPLSIRTLILFATIVDSFFSSVDSMIEIVAPSLFVLLRTLPKRERLCSISSFAAFNMFVVER